MSTLSSTFSGYPFNADAIPGRHTLHYRVLDAHRGNPLRDIEVLATPDEIQALLHDGYLVRPNIISPTQIEELRAALHEVETRENRNDIEQGNQAFGGIFLRHLEDKHPAFLSLVDFAPAVSVARAVFGPCVTLRGLTARICRPGDRHSEVEWHFHMRMATEPLPPMWCRPQALDVLLYLDDITEDNGPMTVVPGSHQWLDADLPTGLCDDMPEQRVLTVPAGSCVLAFGSLWHRALPTSGRKTRRLLISGYSPAWQKPSIYGRKPENGLAAQLLQDPDLPTAMRELLGVDGYH